jgi:tetratricopeptide (TPR) repeat protein
VPVPSRWRRALPWLLLTAATLLAHAGGLRNGFAWDDKFIVVDNPQTRDLSQLGTVMLSPDFMKPYYRPLCRASYLLDYQLFGMDPAGFHAVNLLVHLACILAFFAMCRRLLASEGAALLAAALLAVHPIHVEAVAFVSARNNLLALLFAILSAVLLARAVERRSLAWAAGSAAMFFLALASKEQGAMVLPYLAVWLLVLGEERPRWRALRWLWPHAVALAAYLAVRSVALGGPVASDPIWPGLAGRLARNWYIVPAYLRLALFPDALAISHELPRSWAGIWWLPVAWLAIAGVFFAVWRTRSVPGFLGLVWFAVNLVPVIGIVPLPSTAHTIMAERFVHASAAGLWIVAADLLTRAAAAVPARVAWGAAAAVLVAYGARSIARTRDWSDDLALFRSAAEANPGSLLAHFDLGVELKDRGDLDGARREWERALAVDATDPGTHTQLGTLAAVSGRLDQAERHYRTALQRDPDLAEAALNLAKICERTGRTAEAAQLYGRVVRGGAAPPELAQQAEAALRRLGP